MTPEQRAAKIQRDYLLTGHSWNANLVADITRAIRAAENAALERAAKECAGAHWGGGALASDRIRALKSRAPRARRQK